MCSIVGKHLKKVKVLEEEVTNGRKEMQSHSNPSPFTRNFLFFSFISSSWIGPRFTNFQFSQSDLISPKFHVQVTQSKMSLLIGPVKSHLFLKSSCSDFSILTALEDRASGSKKLKDNSPSKKEQEAFSILKQSKDSGR